MKYTSNLLLALILALLINYLIIRLLSSGRKTSEDIMMEDMIYRCAIKETSASFSHQTTVYNPGNSVDSSSDSGRSSDSGGGGGHSF